VKFVDITGQKFGRLTVIHRCEDQRTKWLCRCDCGQTVVVFGKNLKKGHTKSCGCFLREKVTKDLTGKVFGRLRVVLKTQLRSGSGIKWECLCSCGNTTIVSSQCLLKGETVSCGCYKLECNHLQNYKHGKAGSRLYKTWHSMHDRCYNLKNKHYKYYGTRGITVCDRWHSLENFCADMNIDDIPFGYSLDRIDNNGNYSPDNCRWATDVQQIRNRTNTYFVTFLGERKSLGEWASIMGLPYYILYRRLTKHKWEVDRAFTTPVRAKRKSHEIP